MNNIHDIIKRTLDAGDIKKCRNFLFDPTTFEPMITFTIRAENRPLRMVRLPKEQTAQVEALWLFENAILSVKNDMMSRVKSFIVP